MCVTQKTISLQYYNIDYKNFFSESGCSRSRPFNYIHNSFFSKMWLDTFLFNSVHSDRYSVTAHSSRYKFPTPKALLIFFSFLSMSLGYRWLVLSSNSTLSRAVMPSLMHFRRKLMIRLIDCESICSSSAYSCIFLKAKLLKSSKFIAYSRFPSSPELSTVTWNQHRKRWSLVRSGWL